MSVAALSSSTPPSTPDSASTPDALEQAAAEPQQVSALDREMVYEVEQLLPEMAKLLQQSAAQHLDLPQRSWPQMRTLGYIYHHGPCALRDVAAGVGVSVASASEMVDRLVEEGVVQREPDPSDRRRVLLSLTEHALAVGDQLHRLRFAQITHAMHALDTDDRPALLRALRVMVAALRHDPQELLDWVARSGITIPPPPPRGGSGPTCATRTAAAAPSSSSTFTATSAPAPSPAPLPDTDTG